MLARAFDCDMGCGGLPSQARKQCLRTTAAHVIDQAEIIHYRQATRVQNPCGRTARVRRSMGAGGRGADAV